jgi:anti-sigma B factor antagonist
MHTTFEAFGSDTVVIWVHGDLDAFAAPDLKKQLFAALDSGFQRVVLEMSQCEFVDSTGLGVLVAALKHARGREVVLASPSPDLRRVLGIVGLDRLVPLCASRAEAIERVH